MKYPSALFRPAIVLTASRHEQPQFRNLGKRLLVADIDVEKIVKFRGRNGRTTKDKNIMERPIGIEPTPEPW